MTTMSLARGIPTHLAQKGRHELIRHVMNIRSGIQKHKAVAKHAGKTVVAGAAAAAGGAIAGGLAVKMPHIPKTKLRTDLVLGAAVGGACAFGVFDEHSETVGALAHGLIGYGTGDAVKTALLARGVRQAA